MEFAMNMDVATAKVGKYKGKLNLNKYYLHELMVSNLYNILIFLFFRLFCVNVEVIEPQVEHCDRGYKCDCQHEWNGSCFGVCVPEFDDVVGEYANILDV